MKKTLFTAALALVLSVGGFVLSAQEAANSVTLEKRDSLVKLVVQSKLDVNLKNSLTKSAGDSSSVTFGYVKNDGKFVSLVDVMADAEVANGEEKSSTLVLGKFQKGDTIQFGYGNSDGLAAAPTVQVASDAGFHAGYDIDSFYHLDFPKDPFDGKIDIYIVG